MRLVITYGFSPKAFSLQSIYLSNYHYFTVSTTIYPKVASFTSNGSKGSDGAYHLKKWFMMNLTVCLFTWKFSRPSSK